MWPLTPRQRASLIAALAQGWADGVRLTLTAGADPDHVNIPEELTDPEVRELLETARRQRRAHIGSIGEALATERSLKHRATHWRDRLLGVLDFTPKGSRKAWAVTAAELGLRLTPGPGPGQLRGQIEGHDVQVEAVGHGTALVTRIEVAGVPAWLALRRETLHERLGLTTERFMTPSAASQWMKTNDVITRDQHFDERIDVKGPIADSLALLSQPIRELVLDFVDELGGLVADGCVTLEVAGVVADSDRLVGLVRACVQLAQALSRQVLRGTLTCLAENAANEPFEGVRTQMLSALGERHPSAPETLAAAHLALVAGHYDWYRMTGASLLGDEGTTAYQEILADTTQQPAVRGMALRHLGFRLSQPTAEDLVLSYLEAPHKEIVLHAVRVLGEHTGSPRSVEPLQGLVGALPTSEIARAAVQAISDIQARQVDATPGQLSLAMDETVGALTLAQAPGGGSLTLVQDEDKAEEAVGDIPDTACKAKK